MYMYIYTLMRLIRLSENITDFTHLVPISIK